MDMATAARFYLRGDLGYSFNNAPGMTESGYDLIDTSMANTWSYGGGIGWYLTPNWRTDLTIDYRTDASLRGTLDVASAPFGGGDREFNVNSTIVLANVYYDFADRAEFNPYIGAGIGFANNSAHDGIATDACGCTAEIEGADHTNFAWALMAGFTHELDRGWSLDAGYRFLSYGSAATGNILNKHGHAYENTDPETDNLYASELRLGLRFDIY